MVLQEIAIDKGESLFSFGKEQFNRIFPFFVLIDSEARIGSFGTSIAKMHPMQPGDKFTDVFTIKLPKAGIQGFDSLKRLAGQTVVLDIKKSEVNSLRGQFEYLDGPGYLLFIGTPYIRAIEDIKANNLSVADFAKHDALIDRLLSPDIAQQMQLEQQLKINEKRYRDLFNYSQAYIFTHDLDGRLLSVNPALCDKLGYTEKQLIGRMITDFVPKNDLANFQSTYLDAVKEKGIAKGIFRVIGKTDKKSFLLYQNYKVQEENTEPYIIGFSQDITEQVKIEKELRKTKKNIEDQANAKEFFLANMSHEIRTPLTGLLGITGLLSNTQLTEQQKKYTSLITSSANILLSIVNDILDIEKISSGKFELEHIPFKLEEKVRTTIQAFQFKAEEKKLSLAFKSNVADDLIVIGDPSRLGQILNNLLSNAIKFTNSGGIYVNVYYYKNGSKSTILEFEVSDTGIGIKADRIDDIFNPFVQASAATSRKFGGTGLGLSICKELIEMHGGSITVNSVVNGGTTFTFYLPYDKGDGSMIVQESEEDLDYDSLKGLKILVAEDWELNQFLVQYILESWGCEVSTVKNGQEALDIVKTKDFDLILMDIHMPEMDGITATKKIRALKNKTKSKVPIVALTANALKRDHMHYLDVGMNDCVTKPYTEGKLFHVISHIIMPDAKHKDPKDEIMQEADADFIEQSNLLYDLSFINEFAKGDTSFVKKMINVFLDAMVGELKQLVAADAADNFADIHQIAHKMKSAIDGLGISSLKQTIRDLENIKVPTADTAEHIKPLVQKIKTTLDEVFVQLEAFLKL